MEDAKLDALFAGVEHDLVDLNKRMASEKHIMRELKTLIIDKFEALVAKHPKKPFVIYDDMVYTYEAIDNFACRVAHIAKSMGLQQGDCVAIMIQNEASFIYTFFGLLKLGISVALVNHNLKGHPLIYCISVVDCKSLIVGSGKDLLDAVTEVLPQLGKLSVYVQDAMNQKLPIGVTSFDDLLMNTLPIAISPSVRSNLTLMDTLCFIYTSGTTGNPKPVYISHMKSIVMSCGPTTMIDHNQDDIMYIVLPLYHSTGMILGLFSTIIVGACIALRKKFSARHHWDDCRKYKVTKTLYVGELFRYLITQPKNKLDGVHNIQAALGAGLRADIWNEVKERFKIPKIAEFFGATEGYSGIFSHTEKPGAVGRLSPFMSRFDTAKRVLVKYDLATATPVRNEKGRCIPVKVGEPGLLLSIVPDHLRKNMLYKASPKENEKKFVKDAFVPGDLYMNYGDSLVMDKDYFVYFHDRLGDTFRWKGENVSTKEVANEINALPFIEDTSVYGVPVPGRDGKAGMAAISLNSNATLGNKELQDLYEHVNKELPTYARPLFVRHLPEQILTGTFKNKKGDMAKEGYDLDVIKDPLFFLDNDSKTYSRLTKTQLMKFMKSKL